ncbi:hypothetical protein [Armatimonas sp.]|uniref:hypothetical protein n=1 Tax=Armatimonas sp. TaxID=1872638 RepID=UPI00286A662F|nr:hypothetical protein [Armatimonas sp.]
MTKLEIGLASAANGGLFDLGALVGTPGAVAAMQRVNVTARELLKRHHTGDWGDIHPEDVGLNEEALETGARIFSVYKFPHANETIWIITEADRSVTTILLPEDY